MRDKKSMNPEQNEKCFPVSQKISRFSRARPYKSPKNRGPKKQQMVSESTASDYLPMCSSQFSCF